MPPLNPPRPSPTASDGFWCRGRCRRPRTLPRRRQRWQRIAAEAAKQCERDDLPTVAPPRPLGEVLRASTQPDAAKLMLYERATAGLPDRAALAAAGPNLAPPCLLLVGPEGGFTDDEVRQAREAGFRPFSLGPLILRSETAVIAALSLVRFLRGELVLSCVIALYVL
ncbi:MAG: RNA methyltransferase [Candidatus Tectomicrobia bacterium]|nr:RNA methyltransferase [Candidatus Tectomicrobia bacterium]